MTADLKKIYRVFDPAPLSGEKSELYVPLDDVRGSSGLVPRLTKPVRLSDKATFQLLAGHIGSGKSTELRRVQKDLETREDRFFTVFCQVLEDIDPSDADFPDILLAIMRQVAAEFRERLNVKLKPGYLRQRLGEVKELLGSEVKLESLAIDSALGNFTAAIKSSPSTRDQIRKALAATTERWIDAANDVLGEALTQAQKRGYAGIAIIVDDLDKLSMLHEPELRGSVAERLYLERHVQLTSFRCHMIYTIPIALAYSCKEREIASRYGMTAPPVVPMTKVVDINGNWYEPGFEKFRAVIARRLEDAAANEADVFASTAVRDRIIECSGGQPRFLITMMRDAIVEGDLPLTEATVNLVARKATHSYSRQLRKEHWKIIEQVRKTHALERTDDNDALCMDLLATGAILQYLNEKEWYAPNPLLPERTKR
ncbi:MAG: ATP-binding protein [Planctomycetes bacterium]|nr:ATP-binding protein [Planctomycetota bacterium]